MEFFISHQNSTCSGAVVTVYVYQVRDHKTDPELYIPWC